MIEGQPDRPGRGGAARRRLDRPLVFEDPPAPRIIGTGTEAALHSGPTRYTDPRVARLRAFPAVRVAAGSPCGPFSIHRSSRSNSQTRAYTPKISIT